MKNFGIYPKITKDYILNRISQEDIMGKFLNIPVTNETLKSNSISSPYRTDENASCNYYYNEQGRLRFRDHTTGLNYDIFDVVGKELGVSSNSKQGFVFCLHEIARAFRIHKYENFSEVKKYDIIKQEHLKRQKKRKNLIEYKVILRKFNYYDKEFWGKGKLEFNDLKGVYFIQTIYVSYDRKPFKHYYSYSPYDPCYGYYGLKDKGTKIDLWKFYFPLRIKGDKRGTRFKSNGYFIQGFQYLVPDRFCILTKSFKDVKVFNKAGLQSCSVSAESTEITPQEASYLKSMFDYVVTCFDYDYTGIKLANLLRKKYNFHPFFFNNSFDNKDAFEYTSINDISSLRTLIQQQYNLYKY